ncbi:hypothetical protein [Microbacterium sp. B19]|uniref:hypothetical protein n=1 Tax=Microbacterium sp. B19 TaxID=96765 RepID=UPI0003492119|nr:hypothetical protein [Microbacterium sp. B19]
MTRRFAVLALVAAIVTAVATVSPAYAAESRPDYIRTAYDGTIFEVTDDDAVPLTFQEWSDLGFPAFRSAPTFYEKVLTFPTVTAVTTFARPGIQLSTAITWPEYQAAGYPAIRTAAWGSSISVHKWGTSPQLLAQDEAGDVISLSYEQWRNAGFPAYTAREGRGFVRLSWDSTGGIAYLCSTATGQGGRLTYDQWRSLGFPTPYTVTRTANDTVRRFFGAQLAYVGAMTLTYNPGGGLQAPVNRALTFGEWQAMGSPAPVDGIPEASMNLGCPPGAPSAWE